MNPTEIKTFLQSFEDKKSRTIVIVDFSNVDKWKNSLGWKVGIQELARLVKNFTFGNKSLRRFYYGSDHGRSEKNTQMVPWSKAILERAKYNHFEVVTKRVKYIHNNANKHGFDKKCDMDVEMAVDLIRLRDEYDNIIVFSGDGDLVYVLRYLKDVFGKTSYVFGARNHIGREVIDGIKEGVIQRILFAEDFESRLNMDRFRYK